MTFETFFEEVKKKLMDADASNITEHLAYQFNITGEAEGIFYVEVKEGKLYVEPYEYYDRDAMFTCTPDILDKIADGELDPVEAFTQKKLKVEGNIEKALRFKEIVEMKKGCASNKTVVQKVTDKVVGAVAKKMSKKDDK